MAEADLHLKLDRILAGQEDAAKAAAELELVMSMLLQGVQNLIPLFATQREMLQRLLEAASDETGDDGEMTKLIQRHRQLGGRPACEMRVSRVIAGSCPSARGTITARRAGPGGSRAALTSPSGSRSSASARRTISATAVGGTFMRAPTDDGTRGPRRGSRP